MTEFVALLPIQEANAENIFSLIEEEIAKCGQTLQNCIGYGSDGASTMVGKNNSVWTRLKSVSPFCVQMRCICHSMALCIEHAASKLPSNVGFVLSEIPHWFCNSGLRSESFKLLYSVMNQEASQNPTPRPRRGRWKQVKLANGALVKL